jgi:hypothetical protein
MRTVKAALCAAVVSLGLATAATAPAEAYDGLVSVVVGDISTGDILSRNRVTVKVGADIAANVCGIQVSVSALSALLDQGGTYRCTNKQTGQFVRIRRIVG